MQRPAARDAALARLTFTTDVPAAVRAYFVGMFVNVFGLGTLGGDLAR